jgi:hypothetical protein
MPVWLHHFASELSLKNQQLGSPIAAALHHVGRDETLNASRETDAVDVVCRSRRAEPAIPGI